MTAEPTERQREVLAAIASYHKKHKVPPSREDLRQATGVKHLNSIVRHIQLLSMKGLVMPYIRSTAISASHTGRQESLEGRK